jgi:pimeloyl-ACP methyl ester carboxylesterase
VSDFPAAVRVPLTGRADDPDFALSVHERGEGPAVVFCHGFPDLARTWRTPFAAVAEAGYRVLAPDMRGYGASSRPEAVHEYGLTELTGDLVALLDARGIERAAFVGHDWGGFVVWAMPVLHPSRVAGIAALCTPYMPFPSVAVHAALVGGEVERQYVAWFQEPGVAEQAMDPDVRVIFDRVMRCGVPREEMLRAALADGKLNMNPFLGAGALPRIGEPVMSPQELELYCRTFERTSFRGGINWYRNVDRNLREHPAVGTAPLSLPCLMLMAELDPFLSPDLAANMRERCSDLEMHSVAGAGHWVQREKAGEVAERLVGWLQRRFPSGRPRVLPHQKGG